jgi:hypothetical protein
LSTQDARICTVEPGCAVVGLTDTKTLLRFVGGALPWAAASAADWLFALCDNSAQPANAASVATATAVPNNVRVMRISPPSPVSVAGSRTPIVAALRPEPGHIDRLDCPAWTVVRLCDGGDYVTGATT